MDTKDPRLKQIWLQSNVPVIYQQTNPNQILVRMTISEYDWVRASGKRGPKWNYDYKCWQMLPPTEN